MVRRFLFLLRLLRSLTFNRRCPSCPMHWSEL